MEFKKDALEVNILPDRKSLGIIAANEIGNKITELLKVKEYVNIVFASAPSQNEFLEELVEKRIEWNRINAFHMDEYIGLNENHPQSFGNYLKLRLFDIVPLHSKHYINGTAQDPITECARYSHLLIDLPTDIVCLGIGENTHLAFNDPHVADFKDIDIVKIVDLDMNCRLQQINDGCFATLDEVPTHALTITIPALLKSSYAYAMVPGKTKINAIYYTLNAAIEEKYPSTILRRHPHAKLFIDTDSAARLSNL